jgi:hypothetical protein
MIARLLRFTGTLWLGIAVGVVASMVAAMWSVAKSADGD